MATLSEALGLVADVRERLERETAEMANRSSAQLIALDDAISRVRAERDRTRIAVEDERVRLERLGLDAARLDADHAAQAQRAEQLARQIESQQIVIDVLEADLARARAAALEAATAHVQSRLRAGAARRERRAELERSRGEIARLSARRPRPRRTCATSTARCAPSARRWASSAGGTPSSPRRRPRRPSGATRCAARSPKRRGSAR